MSDFKFKEGDIVLCVLPEESFEAKIISRNYIMDDGETPTYQVQAIKNGTKITISEDRMMYSPNYAVSYIASAPDEPKVGDRVEVVDHEAHNFRGVGIVEYFKDQYVVVRFENETTGYSYVLAQLRKLPDTISFEEKENPLDRQVGGSHYKDMAIQPVEFCMKNKLDFCTSSAIKYLCRHKNKNGKEDLLKAKHFIDLLIQLEYPE